MKRSAISILAVLILLHLGTLLRAQVPQLMHYQAYVTDTEGNPVNGPKTVTYSMYTESEGSNPVWTETKTDTIRSGYLSTLLGSGQPIHHSVFDTTELYLGIKIGNDPEMTPRKRMVSVGYAFHAHTADWLDSLTSGDLIQTMNQVTPKNGNVDLIAGDNITLTPDTANHQITISSAGGAVNTGWALSGNSGTTAGTDFLGTTDDEPFEIKVANTRAMRIEHHDTAPNIIAGSELNTYENDAYGVTISGGGGTNENSRNLVTDIYGTIGGGLFNRAGNAGTVAGGVFNRSLGQESCVGGGNSNHTMGYASCVPGGQLNRARGDYSFAAGFKAKANHLSSYVWSSYPIGQDSIFSTGPFQYIVYAPGGVGIGTNAPGEALSVAGTIESETGGFKFPDGTVQTTAADTGASGWLLTGNSDVTSGTHFLGTTNNQSLEIRTNNTRALLLQPDADSPNLIGGHSENNVFWNVHGATITGGGTSGAYKNSVTGNYGTISGGQGNQAGELATVGGGGFNSATESYTTVGGGYFNSAQASKATIGGGSQNRASTFGATVGGGTENTASGRLSCIPGGSKNAARGSTSFAAGYNARANHWGSFVFSDVSSADSMYSTADNQFIIRAAGGVGIGTTDPKGALDVNGTIYQRGSELHADYVFETDYALESIEDHANFMWSNKHLKAIPKAATDENGDEIVEVGAHQKGIVEELEKAHIYIQQLHERLAVLEEMVARMEAEKTVDVPVE